MCVTGVTYRRNSSTAPGMSSGAPRGSPLVGVLGQRLAGAGEQTTSGLVARDEEDLRHRELLLELERLPLPFGLGQLGEEVVAGLPPGP